MRGSVGRLIEKTLASSELHDFMSNFLNCVIALLTLANQNCGGVCSVDLLQAIPRNLIVKLTTVGLWHG